MKQKVESFKTMRQSRMEIREKLDLLEQNPRQAIEEEEQRHMDLSNYPEKKEIFSNWILPPSIAGQGWLYAIVSDDFED